MNGSKSERNDESDDDSDSDEEEGCAVDDTMSDARHNSSHLRLRAREGDRRHRKMGP